MVHVAVIGAYGSAGVAAAEGLLDAADDGRIDGLQLSLIDGGEPGGLCILRGCMPSKDVLSAAQHRYQARHDERLEGSVTVDVERTIARKDEHVVAFAGHRAEGVGAMADDPRVTMFDDPARFVDPSTLTVGDERLDIDYAVVATGSVPTIPPIPGIDSVEVLTSADVLDATAFPDSAVVVGFGFIGMELAPYLAEVGGVDVTVIDRNDRPLSDVEPAFGDAVIDLYERDFGIEVATGAAADRVESTGDGVDVTYQGTDGEAGTVSADALYAFAGRTPNLNGLNLQAADIDVRPGWVDETLRAVDNPRVFVAGDANGSEPILHIAKEEGYTAADNITRAAVGGRPAAFDATVHRVVFSGLGVYPFARVGHSEASARAAGHEVVTATRAASDDGVFRVKAVPEGLAKLVVDAETGRVLGYLGLHHHADVFAKLAQVLVETGVPVDELPDRAYHPTTPELLDGLIRETATTLVDR